MITIYKSTEQGTEQLESIASGAWVNVVEPTAEETQKLMDWGMIRLHQLFT
jgi:hypothetical protein